MRQQEPARIVDVDQLSKHPISQENEVLAKFVCHNIWVLNRQSKMLDIDLLAELDIPLPEAPSVNGRNGSEPVSGPSDLPAYHPQPCICLDCRRTLIPL